MNYIYGYLIVTALTLLYNFPMIIRLKGSSRVVTTVLLIFWPVVLITCMLYGLYKLLWHSPKVLWKNSIKSLKAWWNNEE